MPKNAAPSSPSATSVRAQAEEAIAVIAKGNAALDKISSSDATDRDTPQRRRQPTFYVAAIATIVFAYASANSLVNIAQAAPSSSWTDAMVQALWALAAYRCLAAERRQGSALDILLSILTGGMLFALYPILLLSLVSAALGLKPPYETIIGSASPDGYMIALTLSAMLLGVVFYRLAIRKRPTSSS